MITQIEKELDSVNEDKFANIARLYLSYRFNNVLSSGFALGQEKSKVGIPDNFMPIKNSYYVYNEITTVKKNKLKSKLKQDVSSCFNQTDIPLSQIAQIILICNRKVSPKLYNEILEHKNKLSIATQLEIIDIGDFATHIFRDYPSLCIEFNIPIDTGQIIEVESFVKQYEKSKFATTLQNQFFNREKEVELGLEILKKDNILIVFGKAGVGKTKFSLEIVRKFLELNSNYIVKYITNNSCISIWEDLKTQLIIDKDYLIVVDDANKLKSNLEFIINFLKEDRKGDIKVLFTIRDYVKSQLTDLLRSYNEIELKNFSLEELTSILSSKEFNINEYGIKKIHSISKGNPRLAIMAATAAINNDYDKFNNAAKIYEQYFSSIKQDLDSYDDKNLLKVAGILALYQSININVREFVQELYELFYISKESLVEKLQVLFNNEFADRYENIYKLSDQILGEYFFYLVFIKEQIIPFKFLLDIYLVKSNFRLIKLLNPIVNNYGFNNIMDLTITAIKQKWSELINNDEQIAFKFLKDFWFYIPDEGLLFIYNKVKDLKKVNNTETLSFGTYESNSVQRYDDEIIEVLVSYYHYTDKLNSVFEILFLYGLSDKVLFTKLLKALKQSFSYNRHSHRNQYKVQQ
ncbi:MAG: hypothetical protein H6630_09420, partial [Arcobacter sp.]|nr:hypothetical protein [Arcobacter sp.]